MIYFLTGILLLCYLEILGQSFLSLIGKDRRGFSFGAGFVLVLFSAYILTSLLTALNCSFYLILVIYTLLLLLSFGLIAKQRKQLAVNFHPLELLLLVLTVGILLFYSLKTGFGDLDGFDSTFYLNMVTNNVGAAKLNSRSVYYGDQSFSIQLQYTFQSYYYLSSVLIFYIEKACSLFHLPFYRTPCFVWPNQILFFALCASLVTDALRRLKEKSPGLIALSIVLVVFYFGRFYFHSVFGFYGNSLRGLLFGQSCCYLLDYQISRNRTDKYLFYITLLAVCASSSSAVFSCFFFLFALYFLWSEKEKDLLKEYAAVLFFPAINLIAVLRDSVLQGFAAGLVLVAAACLLNTPLHKLGRNRRNRLILLALCALAMVILSYLTDGKLFHYEAFVMNNSQRYDMTMNYFYFPGKELAGVQTYKYLILSILLLSILFIRSDLTNVDLILIAVFFNPFCCAFLNKINPVFYRSYDIMINPFTVTFLLNACGNLIPIKYAKEAGALLLTLYLLKFSNLTGPLYYHKSFVPAENYNAVYRMSQEELQTIDALANEIGYHQDKNPKIITANKLTQSMLKDGEYLYGRENKTNPAWGKAENELFNIFYPVEQYYDSADRPTADFDHMCEYLQEAKIDYVVQDKLIDYYDEEQNVWYSMTYLIDRCGEYPFYENERYSVYRYEWGN